MQLPDDYIPGDWYECTLEDWKEKLAEKGFEDAEIFFRGFGSQGDGASFKANVSGATIIKRMPRSLKNRLKAGRIAANLADDRNADTFSVAWIRDNLSASITQGGHYCHEMTMGCRVSLDYGPDFQPLDVWLNEVQDEILSDARDLAREIYDDLQSTYDEYYAEGERLAAEDAQEEEDETEVEDETELAVANPQ